MLYTKKGDSGTTKLFNSKPGERISKSSRAFSSLGTLDEINAYLGICKVKSFEAKLCFEFDGKKVSVGEIIGRIQQDLFIIQAEMAGSKMTIAEDKVERLGRIIDTIESAMPPIKTFFVSGGTELGALFDFGRTIARRAEREAVGSIETGEINPVRVREGSQRVFASNGIKLGDGSRAYLNRLSSILYALARLSNHKSGIKEESPEYK